MANCQGSKGFLSYSHANKDIKRFLFRKSLITTYGEVTFWDDEKIRAGNIWNEAIKIAIDEADWAVLFVGQDFLNSDYITNHEIPYLKKRLGEGELKLFWFLIEEDSREKLEKNKKWSWLIAHQAVRDIGASIPLRIESTKENLENDQEWRTLRQNVLANIQKEIDGVSTEWLKKIRRRYEIKGRLGQGSLAFAFLAEEKKKRRMVAIKACGDTDRKGEFIECVEKTRNITQVRNFPRILDDELRQDPPYCVMEFFEGKTLRQWIDEGYQFRIEVVLKIIRQLGQVLEELHALEFVHRNVKPSNIILTQKWDPVLLPFNRPANLRNEKLAGEMKAKTLRLNQYTTSEDIAYLLPEDFKIHLEKTNVQASDQYMLGLVTYELLVRELPPAISDLDKLERDGSEAIHSLPILIDKNPECPDSISDAVRIMTSRNPSERYKDLKSAMDSFRIDPHYDLAWASFQRCKDRNDFFSVFYAEFKKENEAITDLFKNVNMDRQHRALERAIYDLFDHYYKYKVKNLPVKENQLDSVAVSHKEKNISKELYKPFVKILLETVCEERLNGRKPFDPQCENQKRKQIIKEAWKKTLAPGVDYIMSMY